MTAPDTSGSQSGLLELVTRAANVAYYEWVSGSEELHLSPAPHELFGYDPDIWTRSRAWETFHPDYRSGYRAAGIAYLKSREERAEFVYRSKGRTRVCSMSYSGAPISWPGAAPSSASG
jgi:hypothetical protein